MVLITEIRKKGTILNNIHKYYKHNHCQLHFTTDWTWKYKECRLFGKRNIIENSLVFSKKQCLNSR